VDLRKYALSAYRIYKEILLVFIDSAFRTYLNHSEYKLIHIKEDDDDVGEH
jgi:hypothetical protein